MEAIQAKIHDLATVLKELKRDQSIVTQDVEALKITKDEQNDTLVQYIIYFYTTIPNCFLVF